ncbi:hypothetical protein A9Q84_17975 [Halobacteriovorax marinus]|uniref:Uncharacterized protein n=1 Tax=Halobacteriovorax marinus TaxID=97084 RepID=A0A1Y5F3C1_9BACT|nr:hypothetical protein A9Q84_17975 [Halobacteriovorax marinus]
MIIQFILKAIFFYFAYNLIRSLVRGFLAKPADKNVKSRPHQAQSSHNSGEVFEAEYKVVKEES